MAKYVLTYHGGSSDLPADEAGVAELMAHWGAWFDQLGDALVDGGNPFGAQASISADGTLTEGGVVPSLTGYGIIQAGSMEEAAKLALGCPVLSGGATVHLSEVIEM